MTHSSFFFIHLFRIFSSVLFSRYELFHSSPSGDKKKKTLETIVYKEPLSKCIWQCQQWVCSSIMFAVVEVTHCHAISYTKPQPTQKVKLVCKKKTKTFTTILILIHFHTIINNLFPLLCDVSISSLGFSSELSAAAMNFCVNRIHLWL